MNDFKKIAELSRVPVFYNKASSEIRNSAIRLVVLTGKVDDTLVGKPGLYHWFEHVPFRGTTKFSGGRKNVETKIAETGGRIGASTSSYTTTYHAHLPTKYLGLAVDALVDLVSSPLFREKDINAERKIIKQEISEGMGDPKQVIFHQVMRDIWKGHPLEHPTIGYMDGLSSMDPSILKTAWELGYSTSRMFLVIETNLEEEKVIKLLQKHFVRLPHSSSVSVRKKEHVIKSVKWRPGVEVVLPTKLESSLVSLLLPTDTGLRTFKKDVVDFLVADLLIHGGTNSPLMKEIRHKRSLSYSASLTGFRSPDGGYFGFEVETKSPNKVLKILRENVLFDPRLESLKWFLAVKQAILNRKDMEIPSPKREVAAAAVSIVRFGKSFSEDQFYSMLEDVSFEEMQGRLGEIRLKLDAARTFIFEGGK